MQMKRERELYLTEKQITPKDIRYIFMRHSN